LLCHEKPFDESRRAHVLLLGEDEDICFERGGEPDREGFSLGRMEPLPSRELGDMIHAAPPQCAYKEDL
jgi:hypothetical protein